MVDYVYYMSGGRGRSPGHAATRCAARRTPFVRQFVYGETDGPVPFHYPAPSTPATWDWSAAQ